MKTHFGEPRAERRPVCSVAASLALTVFLIATGACASGTASPAAGTRSAPAAAASTSSPPAASTAAAALSREELKRLESAPGSTPPLTQAVEPAPPPVEGLPGTPGPSPAYGPEAAPVHVFLFTDFQCGVCLRAVEPVKHLARSYPGDVRLVLKHNALANHNRAARLAAASLAALRQGKFWEMHDQLFSHSREQQEPQLLEHARSVGLDVARFQGDIDDEAIVEQVTYERALAQWLGLAATPGLVVNGKLERGWGSYMALDGLVRREIARARTIAGSGTPAGRLAYEATRQSGPKGAEIAAALFPAAK